MRWARGVAVATGLLVVLTPASAAAGGAAPADVTPPAEDPTELLEYFSPVLALRRQAEPCGDGEPYLPVAVDNILGRDDVRLRDADGEVVMSAPAAADLAAASAQADGAADWALDFPGNALDPGCSYERWFDAMEAEPVVYGRAGVDGEFLVAQYWLYYVYNDWNDRHESDWEMIQLVFQTTSVADALAQGPVLYAYAQHEGSEYHFLDDTVELEGATETDRGKVRLIGGSPVVYAGQGSHAAYFNRDQWFGKSGATGFGCDDTSSPLIEVRPSVVVLPTDAPTDGEFAWLSYDGHWGERRPIFNDGPTGPATKDQWDEPIRWVEELGRADAVPTPFGGSPATDAFCQLARDASNALLQALDHPVRFTVIVVLVVAALVLIVRFSSRGLLVEGGRAYRRHHLRLLQIGAALVAAGAVGLLAHWLIVRLTPVGDVLDVLGDDTAWAIPVLVAISAVVSLPIMAWVLAATIQMTVHEHDGRGRPGRWWLPSAGWATFVTALFLVVAFSVGSAVFLLLPLSALIAAFWLVAPAACADELLRIRAGLSRSAALLRGHRWRAIGLLITLTLVLAIPAVVTGLLLIATGVSFSIASLVLVVLAVVLVPYVGVVLALFYGRLIGSAGGRPPLGQIIDRVEPAGAGVVGGAGQQ